MKKIIALILVLVFALAPLTGCQVKDDKTIVVGASVTPHAEILRIAQPLMEAKGYTLEIREFTDYILPNTSVENGDLDANYFQHQPYLDSFNAENNTHIVSVAAIHYEPFGIYGGKSSSLDEIKDGTKIAIPNDGTNEGRALFLLQDLGYITMKDGISFEATILDIAEYKVNIEIIELEAAQLVRSLEDVDFAVINGNYALQGGLNAAEDALATEAKDSSAATTYANVLCVKEGNENNEGILALIECLKSEEVRKHINDSYGGAVVPMF
jgi:D-methionine transport system substrate-binding protein